MNLGIAQDQRNNQSEHILYNEDKDQVYFNKCEKQKEGSKTNEYCKSIVHLATRLSALTIETEGDEKREKDRGGSDCQENNYQG